MPPLPAWSPIGAPIYIPKVYNGKNRSFFFFSAEGARGGQLKDVINPTVPATPWRSGDFSRETAAIKDPLNGNAPFPGKIIPTSQINAVSQKIQDKFYPLPNTGDPNVLSTRNFNAVLGRPFDPSTYWTTRLDHRFSDRAFLFGRFTWAKQYTPGLGRQPPHHRNYPQSARKPGGQRVLHLHPQIQPGE